MGCVIVKTCTKCGVEKDLDEFTSHVRQKDGKQSRCRACAAVGNMQWARANPEKVAARSRRYRLKKRYGITTDDYDQMFVEQDGACAICGSKPESPRNQGDANLSVDHDHESGQVRGLLCHPCNRSIGLIGDHNLAAAAAYIEKYQLVIKKESA